MLNYEWPGNVRELANALERASVLAPGLEIRPEDLPESTLETDSPDLTMTRYHEALDQAKKEMILRSVAETGGNITEAAERLGLHPNYLHRLISKLGLRGRI